MSYSENQKYAQELAKHKQFLSKFKVFPDKTRKIIYTSLLRLPLNHHHFLEATKPYRDLPQHTPNKQTAFIVNSLLKIYPTLNCQWLPGLIYPFIKLFEEDSIICFQSSLTFLLNWYQPILQNYPKPSKRCMEFAQKFLPNLNKKVNAFDYTLSSILNPMILVCLTDSLNKQDSLQLLDFLVAHPYTPQYFLCAAISIVGLIEEKLCKLNSIQEISLVLKKQKKISVDKVINSAIEMVKQNQKQLRQIYKNKCFPLSKQRYPVYQFIKKEIKKDNNAIQKAKYQQMDNLNRKYAELNDLINEKLREGLVANSMDVSNRYQQVEGQTLNYINKVRREHQMKLQALRQIQQKFKSEIAEDLDLSRDPLNQKNLKAIERRGRLEKEILKLEQQARKIRQLQEDLMIRMHKVAQMKRDSILEVNRKLQDQERLQDVLDFYSN